MGELTPMGAVGEQAAERADDRVDGLTAERGQGVDQRDLATELRRFERGGYTGDAGSHYADVGGHLPPFGALRAPNDAGGGRDFRVVCAHCRQWLVGTGTG